MRRKTITAKEVSFAGSAGNPNRHQHSSVRELSPLPPLSLSLSSLSPLKYFSLCKTVPDLRLSK